MTDHETYRTPRTKPSTQGSACWDFFTALSPTELTDHERCQLCSAILLLFHKGNGETKITDKELRSMGTRLACNPKWRAVFATDSTL